MNLNTKTQKSNKTIEKNLANLMLKMIKYPEAKVCKHHVCVEILDMMVHLELKVDESLVKAIVNSNDVKSKQILKKILK